jgi:hypothetical protein
VLADLIHGCYLVDLGLPPLRIMPTLLPHPFLVHNELALLVIMCFLK